MRIRYDKQQSDAQQRNTINNKETQVFDAETTTSGAHNTGEKVRFLIYYFIKLRINQARL